jgi:hypothetical protein
LDVVLQEPILVAGLLDERIGRLDYAMFIVAYFVVQIAITLGVLAVLRPKESAGAVTPIVTTPTSAHGRW